MNKTFRKNEDFLCGDSSSFERIHIKVRNSYLTIKFSCLHYLSVIVVELIELVYRVVA